MATDKFATESLSNAVDFSESAPSAGGLGVMFLITAGGVVFDAHATGILKAEEGSLKLGLKDEAAHLPGGASAEHMEATHPPAAGNELKRPEVPAGSAPLPDETVGTIHGDLGNDTHPTASITKYKRWKTRRRTSFRAKFTRQSHTFPFLVLPEWASGPGRLRQVPRADT